MSTTPTSLALTSIADGSQIIASTHRNNNSAVQTAVNALITFFSGGLSSQVVTSGGGTTINYSYPPGYEYGYAEITAPVSLASTTAGAITVVTAPSITFDGVAIAVIDFYAPYVTDTSAADGGHLLYLYEDGVMKGLLSEFQHGAASYIHHGPIRVTRRLTPTAGAHVYSIRGNTTAGAFVTLNAGTGIATAISPAFIRITKA